MKNKLRKLNLMPPDALVKTGDVDHADWNYKPLLGAISRARYHLVKQLLGERRAGRLLEIGYGSGVFLPELAGCADEIYGVDIHDKQAQVAEKLAEFNIRAELVSGGAEKMPWEDDFFDIVIAVSALEFVADLDAVCIEVNRILKPTGSFVVVTPGQSPLLDFGLKILTGKNAKDDFANRREQILPTLYKNFIVRDKLSFPNHSASPVKFYTALELQPKD
ncbi:MAG: class I SAM-dependent methyltransferase [Pyrinomonadaceae bacterium]